MNFKKVLSLLAVGALSVSLLAGCGNDVNENTTTTTTTQPNVTANKTITVVAQNENLSFWQNAKKGAEDAAKKYGYSLTFSGTTDETEDEVKTQLDNLKKAVSDKVSGVVIAPVGDGFADTLSGFYDAQIPVVQIDSGITDDDIEKLSENQKNPVVSTVTTSYDKAGAMCAEKLFEAVKQDIGKSTDAYVIGVIQEDETDDAQDRATGFIEKFTELADADETTKDKYRIEKETEEKFEDSFNSLIEDGAKAVFLASQDVADKVSDMVSADAGKYNDIVFCGFDSGAKQLQWLEAENGPKFIGGVARDSYNLGYNAVEQCIFAVEGKETKEKVEIDGHWYDKNNVDKMKQDGIVFDK